MSSSIAVGTGCGTYTHEVMDITTTPISLDSAVFPASDMASATKSIDVATGAVDFARVG